MVRQLSSLVHHLNWIVASDRLAQLADGELLERFTAEQDAAAFEALIWRHGPMVRDVCRRVLGNDIDADDAFQATFLVLVRRAREVRSRESLAGWLYRVAHRTSTRLGRETARRVARERRAARPEAVTTTNPDTCDWRAALDRDVERLPVVYRDAFVLCHLEGRTQPDAARELGCPVGTLQSRLARAKERLRAGLTARGVTLPAVSLGTVPAALVAATASAAAKLAEGAPTTAVAAAVALSQEVGNTMGLFKAKLVLLALVTTAALGTAIGQVGPPAAPATTEVPMPVGATLEDLKKENERLRREVEALKKKLAVAEARVLGDEPTDQEVIRALPKPAAGVVRDDIVIVKDKILDRLDTVAPARLDSAIGPAQLRVQHWECRTYCTESVELPWPLPPKLTKSRVYVAYVDRNVLVPVKGEQRPVQK
ncbi:ECF RNA polymerase sigma factor SigE [Gemmata obscuriglobus]|uniref:sigma-70 family RNA polymerase sigma factor n=1 Tax=Gemmata obscuriglobus TaxID=114 RepID=UPI00016C45AE|nr:sigma-70 family RNA polymerase sigma factor [Gemmata obscuriglobus]QEG28152.1 ECF RNA polymerase sigma factor SigE [Gemmata obscuriglobus]VTS05839.1 sigma-70 family rna polymerase sigma factor : RNA polymerase sigma factor, sigma-70 family OS=Singulisphaera acidiphila (strain ATCC BAA-1392 / DSM 18658 / VKM B-2454 / MOB10) GN=Sinac_4965 PE=4 SV=1: Sigma70_r2: Sigma70_r4_2 [Gemmata obscuriglobus UQM 2246]